MTLSPVRIAPSILSADFGRLAAEVQALEAAGADLVHVDVMDGHFVPNLTLGPPIVAAIRRATKLPLDVHLMIRDPASSVGQYVDAGADWVSVHAEAATHLQRLVSGLAAAGVRPGVALNPHTPPEALDYVLEDLGFVLVMSVNPGFGGQRFLPSALRKLQALRRRIVARGLDVELEVDGGVNPARAADVRAAGASVLVAGSAVFGAPDYARAIAALREGARRGGLQDVD